MKVIAKIGSKKYEMIGSSGSRIIEAIAEKAQAAEVIIESVTYFPNEQPFAPIHEAFNDSLIVSLKDNKVKAVERFDKRLGKPTKKYLDHLKKENKADKAVVVAWSDTNYKKYKVGSTFKEAFDKSSEHPMYAVATRKGFELTDDGVHQALGAATYQMKDKKGNELTLKKDSGGHSSFVLKGKNGKTIRGETPTELGNRLLYWT